MDTSETAPADRSGDLAGLGVRLLPKEHKVEFLFEMANASEDADGNPGPAGVRMGVKMREGVPLQTIAEYEATVAGIAEKGHPPIGAAPGQLRPVTWEYFKEQGYDE